MLFRSGVTGLAIKMAKKAGLLDKAYRYRMASCNLYRRAAIAAHESDTKSFHRLGRGAAMMADTAQAIYEMAENN